MIDIHNITKSFGSLQVLKGIDLHIKKGEVVSIVGPSGAGKTTLLQIIGTLDNADSGTVTLDGVNVTKLKDKEIAKFRNQHLGFVFQFHQLLPEFTALENVLIPAMIAGSNNKETKQRAKELLDFLGLGNRADHKPSELSGGEKQRLSLARVILKDPKILILDEPTEGIQPSVIQDIGEAIKKINQWRGLTVLIVEQYLDFVLGISDSLYVMERGEIQLHDKTRNVKASDIQKIMTG